MRVPGGQGRVQMGGWAEGQMGVCVRWKLGKNNSCCGLYYPLNSLHEKKSAKISKHTLKMQIPIICDF